VSLNTLHIIGQNGDFERGISCIAFSKLDGGNVLCVVDESNEHSISLWEWQKGEKGHKITETKTSCDPVLAAEFHPMERFTLMTIGKGHIHFWDIEGGTLAKKLGTFEVKFDFIINSFKSNHNFVLLFLKYIFCKIRANSNSFFFIFIIDIKEKLVHKLFEILLKNTTLVFVH
jgi:WD40 repeat protein